MIWHPLSLSLLSLDLVTLYFLFPSLITSTKIVLNWSAGSASSKQILLESSAETASLQGRICIVLQLISFVLLLFAIASVFPKLVPGAMCGTGVLQASGETGTRMLLVRAGALLSLFIWYRLDQNNRLLPEGMLSEAVARAMLLSTPFVLMAILLTVKMLWQLNVEQAVDCCAVVYDQFSSARDAQSTLGLSDGFWLLVFSVLSFLLIATALLYALRPEKILPPMSIGFALAFFWCVTAQITLVHIFSSYYYGVLHHHCPWCLFLPEHFSVGYPLFFAMTIVLLESITLVISDRLRVQFPVLGDSPGKKISRSGWRIVAAITLFFVLAVVPALVWKVRYGVWIG